MALSVRSALSAGQDPPQQRHHRPQRQRNRPERYGDDPATLNEAPIYRDGGYSSQQEPDAISSDSNSGTGTTDDEEQQQTLEQNFSQPATAAAAAAGHAAPSAKRGRYNVTRSHRLLQLPDGGRALKMAWRISMMNMFINVPKPLACTCPSVPHTMMLLLTVDGVPAGVAPQAVTLRGISEDTKRNPRHVLSTSLNILGKYIGYTVTQLRINSRNTEVRADLQSPDHRNQAEAEEAEALSASIAAAAAIVPGNWIETPGSGMVHRKQIQEVYLPAALLRHAFGAPAEYPLKCVLGLFHDGNLIGRTCRTMNYRNAGCRYSVSIPEDHQERLRGSCVVKFRAAAPNVIEVYFRAPTNSDPAPAAPPTPLLNISITPVSAPSGAAAASQHTTMAGTAAAAATAAQIGPEAGFCRGLDHGIHDSAPPKSMWQAGVSGPSDAVHNMTGRCTASATATATLPRSQPGLHNGPRNGSRDPATPKSMLQVSVADPSRTVNNMTAQCIASAAPPTPQPGFRAAPDPSSHGSESAKSVLQANATDLAAAVHNTTVKRTISVLEDAYSPTQLVAPLSRRRLNTGAAMAHVPLREHSNMPLPPVGVTAGDHSRSLAQYPSPGAGFHTTNIKTTVTVNGSSKPQSEGRFAAATKPIKREKQVQQSLLPLPPPPQQQQQLNATTTSAAPSELLDLVSSDSEAEKGAEAVGTGQHHVEVVAAPLPQADTGGGLGFCLEPYASVAQACEQLVSLLDRLSAPDDLMKHLQVALMKLHCLGDKKNSCERIEVFRAHYSFVRSWVGRGKAGMALAAVKELLSTAVAGAD